jgi:hypothetical protein
LSMKFPRMLIWCGIVWNTKSTAFCRDNTRSSSKKRRQPSKSEHDAAAQNLLRCFLT